MPLYPYRCNACQTTLEVLAKMSDSPPQKCESCGAEGQMNKLLARTSFQLRGGGWYRQGYEGTSNREGSTQSDGAPTDKSSVSERATEGKTRVGDSTKSSSGVETSNATKSMDS